MISFIINIDTINNLNITLCNFNKGISYNVKVNILKIQIPIIKQLNIGSYSSGLINFIFNEDQLNLLIICLALAVENLWREY